MKIFKKIWAAAYLLTFCLYAISPIITTISNVSSWQSISHKDTVSTRLMLFDVLAGSPYKETSLRSRPIGNNILLRKKRGILPTKILLETIICHSLALDRPQADQVLANVALEHVYYHSTLYFFFSDISPPSLS